MSPFTGLMKKLPALSVILRKPLTPTVSLSQSVTSKGVASFTCHGVRFCLRNELLPCLRLEKCDFKFGAFLGSEIDVGVSYSHTVANAVTFKAGVMGGYFIPGGAFGAPEGGKSLANVTKIRTVLDVSW